MQKNGLNYLELFEPMYNFGDKDKAMAWNRKVTVYFHTYH